MGLEDKQKLRQTNARDERPNTSQIEHLQKMPGRMYHSPTLEACKGELNIHVSLCM